MLETIEIPIIYLVAVGSALGLAAAAWIIYGILAGEKEGAEEDNSGGVGDADARPAPNCDDCTKARRMWNRWSVWKKIARHSWFIYKKIQCEASGCTF